MIGGEPGNWRPGWVCVRNTATGDIVHEGVDRDLLEPLIHEFTQYMNDDRDSPEIVKASRTHLNLAMLHPFSDGNGRVARCLHTAVLANEGIVSPIFSSIEEYIGRNQQAYYDVLAEVGGGGWNPDRDCRPWVRFCLAWALSASANAPASNARNRTDLWRPERSGGTTWVAGESRAGAASGGPSSHREERVVPRERRHFSQPCQSGISKNWRMPVCSMRKASGGAGDTPQATMSLPSESGTDCREMIPTPLAIPKSPLGRRGYSIPRCRDKSALQSWGHRPPLRHHREGEVDA